MKQEKPNKQPFSLEDFEKGLMLAGFIFPNSINELHEKMELDKLEKEIREHNKQIYFKRIVLGAKIVSDLYEHSTFGRIKFQKLMFLCEHAANLNTLTRYAKQAAGPFDNKFMHSIEIEFESRRWFEIVKLTEGKITRTKYIPLEKVLQYESYYRNYFSEYSSRITYIIDLFKPLKTDTTEIAATLLACYLEIDKDEQALETRLFEKFYAWSKEKNRFDLALVKNIWNWMKEKDLLSSI